MSTRIESAGHASEEGAVRCPDCGWAGEHSELVMTKAAALQCPDCYDRH
jgi:predicted RNA-binding Zn-ribbon protein involved in translation (DUF1610 family)